MKTSLLKRHSVVLWLFVCLFVPDEDISVKNVIVLFFVCSFVCFFLTKTFLLKRHSVVLCFVCVCVLSSFAEYVLLVRSLNSTP